METVGITILTVLAILAVVFIGGSLLMAFLTAISDSWKH